MVHIMCIVLCNALPVADNPPYTDTTVAWCGTSDFNPKSRILIYNKFCPIGRHEQYG